MHRLGTSVVFVLLFHLLQGVIPVTSQLQQPIGLEDTVTATVSIILASTEKMPRVALL